MGIRKYQKLNHLQEILPEGLLVDSSWLQKKGYSRPLIAKYVHSGWLASPVRGIYRRDSALLDQTRWEPAAVSMQKLLNLPIVVGGRTALELHGYVHYLSLAGTQKIHLYGLQSPPSWVEKMELRQVFSFHSTKLFELKGSLKRLDKEHRQAHFAEYNWGPSEWTLLVSTPERAILELLDELPTHETFDQANALFESLTNLRPRYLDILLADCRSVKTKRLFMWFAQRHNHAWFKRINTQKINLGTGKRMLLPGGKLDPKYLITVPQEFANDR